MLKHSLPYVIKATAFWVVLPSWIYHFGTRWFNGTQFTDISVIVRIDLLKWLELTFQNENYLHSMQLSRLSRMMKFFLSCSSVNLWFLHTLQMLMVSSLFGISLKLIPSWILQVLLMFIYVWVYLLPHFWNDVVTKFFIVIILWQVAYLLVRIQVEIKFATTKCGQHGSAPHPTILCLHVCVHKTGTSAPSAHFQ